MSRYDKTIGSGHGEPLGDREAAELLRQFGEPEISRKAAIACYLSGSEGCKAAGKLLGGAFAETVGRDG